MISFKSKITSGLLNYFFINQDAEHYINELAKILDLDPKNLYRKLNELEKEGLFKSEFKGKERYFSLVKNHPLLNHYRKIFLKTIGVERRLVDIMKSIKNVKEAYIFGSYAKDKMDSASDIDLLVIGNHSVMELQRKICKIQKEIAREFNVVNFNPEEYKTKRQKKDQFLKNVFSGKIIRIL